MKRSESLILFKPPKAWALRSNYTQCKEADDELEMSSSLSQPKEFPHARIATGVSSIMYDENGRRFNGLGDSFVKFLGCFIDIQPTPFSKMCQ